MVNHQPSGHGKVARVAPKAVAGHALLDTIVEHTHKETPVGNLGLYQTITQVVKTLGGPKKAMVIVGSAVAFGGYLVLRGAEAGAKKGVTMLRAALKADAPCPMEGQLFAVTSDGEDGGGLKVCAGDQYRVLECDGDAILIELLGDPKNPYFVSGEFLATISGFIAETE